MINAVHAIVFTPEAEALRAFVRDKLELKSVDAGGGWLIFALPPAELAAHPTDGSVHSELFFMCDDIEATVAQLEGRGVQFSGEITEQPFGRMTAMLIPGGGELGLYEPHHPTAIGLDG